MYCKDLSSTVCVRYDDNDTRTVPRKKKSVDLLPFGSRGHQDLFRTRIGLKICSSFISMPKLKKIRKNYPSWYTWFSKIRRTWSFHVVVLQRNGG